MGTGFGTAGGLDVTHPCAPPMTKHCLWQQKLQSV